MKKIIISACALVLLAIGCNSGDDKTAEPMLDTSQAKPADSLNKKTAKAAEDCKGRDMGHYKAYSKGDVGVMADHYRDLVWEYYLNATQRISLDPQILQEIACNAKTIKLISTAEDKDVSMIIEYAKDGESQEIYYDVKEIFGRRVLCPPPNNCGISSDTSRRVLTKEELAAICKEYDMKGYHPISPEEAKKMAEEYLNALKADNQKVIQQITMDPDLLYAILCGVEGFNLIAAADDKGGITVLVMYQRNGKTTYYNIKEIFGESALCPPPDNCGIPYNGMIKKGTKRPVQKNKGK